ncbi:separin protein [Pleosporales sp. CAS-2024a]
MPPRRDKADASAPRKRTLVSCDRCKLRRARCHRDNADDPCADCVLAGLQCESKLPRKQRVYGSVETLSLRYRALEALVKGLFPHEPVHDTNVLFKLAADRNIPMPDNADYTPADIFHNPHPSAQRPLPTEPPHVPDLPESTLPVHQVRPTPFTADQSVRSNSTSSRASTTKPAAAAAAPAPHNPFSEVQLAPERTEELIQTRHGVPHYFGPSSSFRLAMTIRTLSARYKAVQNHNNLLPKLQETDSSSSDAATSRPPIALQPGSTHPSDEEYTFPDQKGPPSPARAQKKRSKSKTKTDGHHGHHGHHHQTEQLAALPALETFADVLPSRSLADALVSAYFDHVHKFTPLFHRSIFQYQLEATFARQSEPLVHIKDTGWLICLAMVFAFGCEQLHQHDPEQARILRLKYLGVAKAHFRRLLTTTSLANIQALLLLNLHYHTLGQKSTSWLLVGLAARMAITMGMHRGGSNNEFDPIERNTRRQVFLTIYILEKFLCSILGRPTVIDEVEMNMRLPDSSMLEQQGMPADYLAIPFELAQMSYRMRQRAYFDPVTAEERSPSLSIAIELLRECDQFMARAPQYFLPSFPLPSIADQKTRVLLFHMTAFYYYIRCIITRDFLIQKVERDISYMENRLPPMSENWETTFALSEDCVESAHQSICCIMTIRDSGFLGHPYANMDVFFVLHAVLIVCADFLARPKEQQTTPKDEQRRQTIRSLLDQIRGMKGLAPTYRTLKDIAVQFAGITGVYQEPVEAEKQPRQPSDMSTTETQSGSGQDIFVSSAGTDFEEDWFASATVNLGLDFSDLNSLTAGVPLGGQVGELGFPGHVQPMVNHVEDWTAGTLRGIHSFDK